MVGYFAITKGHKNTIITLFQCQIYALTSRKFHRNYTTFQGIFRAKSKKFELCVAETLFTALVYNWFTAVFELKISGFFNARSYRLYGVKFIYFTNTHNSGLYIFYFLWLARSRASHYHILKVNERW